MFLTFLFLEYLRKISNYLERISLFDLTHRMNMVDLVAISEETPIIDSGDSLKKDSTELIQVNPQMGIIQNYQSG